MKTFCIVALLAASLTQTSCGLAQAPINLLGRMLQSGGNLLHSANTKTTDDYNLDSSEVKKALAVGEKIDVRPEISEIALALR